MKKLFMVLSILVLTFSMSSMVLAKEFSDVKDTNYSQSVKMLTELNVISGYEDNTFKPNKEIKRSEMAKMLIVALGKEDSVKKQVTKQTFPDVSTTHWAAGYIELASELNLIKGYPNGKFAPDDKVSYVEAVAMMLRALNYNDEITDLTWPDGYMQKASDIKLTTNVSYNSANDDAIRGEISNMLWNTMNAYTREKADDNTYANGDKLIEEAFADEYTYISNVTVNDIDLEDETITVKVNNKNTEFAYDATATELKKLYGRTIVSALYDKKNKEFVSFELSSNEKVVYGTVSDIVNGFLYIGKSAYKIPSASNIMLIGISDINSAEEVYIVTTGTTVKSMLGEGDEELYVGVVVDDDIEIDDEDAIAVETLNGEKEYVLADSNAKIYDGDVIVYTLNSEDELVLKKAIDVDDSLEITSLTSSAIKLDGENKVTLSTLEDYVIVMVEDGEYIEEIKLDEADKDYDTAAIVKVGDTSFIVVFYDGLEYVDSDDDDTDTDDELYIGVVLDNNIEVDDEDGIELETLDGEEEYALNDPDEDIEEEDVLIYTLNSDDELIVKKIVNIEDSLEITSLSSTAIKLNGKSKVTLSDLDDYEIVLVENGSTITDADLDDADEEYDTAVITKVGDSTFIIIFYDGLEELEDEEETTMTKSQAKSALNTAIKNAKAKKESNYTIASWAKLESALEAAEDINTSTATASKMQTAAKNLNTAISGLKKVTTSDKTLRASFADLQDLIADAEAIDESDYTSDSYANVSKYLTAAKKIKITSTTLSKVETAIDNLDSAMKLLVSTTAAENLETAKTRLEKAKSDAAKLNEADYTATSWSALEKALESAKDIDYASDTSTEINNVARNIEEAIIALVTKADDEKQKAITTLKASIAEAESLTEAKYTTSTWAVLEGVMEDIEVYDGVFTGLTTSQINTLNSRLTAAIDGLEETVKRENLIRDLETRITYAKELTQEDWTALGTSVTWETFQSKLDAAENAYENRDDKTYIELKAAYDDLCDCLGI